LSRAEVDMKWHPQARILLEVAVMEICSGPVNAEIKEKAPNAANPVASISAVKVLAENPGPKLADLLSQKIEPVLNKSNGGNTSISQIKAKWEDILEDVKSANIFAFISLHEGEPAALEDRTLTIRFKKGFAFHKERLDEGANREAVERSISKVTGKDIKIECVIDISAPKTDVSASKVAELFGGQVVS